MEQDKGIWENTKEKVSDMAEATKEKLVSAKNTILNKSEEASDHASQKARELKNTASKFFATKKGIVLYFLGEKCHEVSDKMEREKNKMERKMDD